MDCNTGCGVGAATGTGVDCNTGCRVGAATGTGVDCITGCGVGAVIGTGVNCNMGCGVGASTGTGVECNTGCGVVAATGTAVGACCIVGRGVGGWIGVLPLTAVGLPDVGGDAACLACTGLGAGLSVAFGCGLGAGCATTQLPAGPTLYPPVQVLQTCALLHVRQCAWPLTHLHIMGYSLWDRATLRCVMEFLESRAAMYRERGRVHGGSRVLLYPASDVNFVLAPRARHHRWQEGGFCSEGASCKTCKKAEDAGRRLY